MINWVTELFAPVCLIAARIAAWGTESNALEASHATSATTFLEDNFWITRSLILFMASAVDRPGIPPKRFCLRALYILA